MTSPGNSIVERLRRAGSSAATSPDLEAIMARSAQRKRRRQIGVTAASVVVVGGLGLGSARLLTQGQAANTSINAAAAPIDGSLASPATTTVATDADQPEAQADVETASAPTTTRVPRTTTVNDSGSTEPVKALLRAPLDDGQGGSIVVDGGTLVHLWSDGTPVPIDLPVASGTTQRRVTDVAMLDERPFLLISDFTDRPDLVAEMTADLGAGATKDELADLMYQELAIYAVDLTTDDVHTVEERTIDDRTSPEWVYNGHVTAQNGHLMVVRELWQSMCVYVEGIQLDGTRIDTPENPLPEPRIDDLSDATMRSMQAGTLDLPEGCTGIDDLPDGAMSVLGLQADAAAIEAINAQLEPTTATSTDGVGEQEPESASDYLKLRCQSAA